LASKPRGWTGARTPSAIKRVRTAERREAINGPRRSAAKTFVAKALRAATVAEPEATGTALALAMSALDKAAKTGAIHRNAAARRKSRLTRKVNAALGGELVQTGLRATKTTGKAAAAKAAKARVAASKAVKAKGAQTAAGKARAALSKTARVDTASAQQPASAATTIAAPTRPRAASARAAGGSGSAATKPAAKAAKAAPKAAPKPAKSAAAPKAKATDKKAAEKKSPKS
jgi:small subunit ribosomal protein S20